LGAVDRRLFGEGGEDVDPWTAVARYRPYIARERAHGIGLPALVRPMLGLFHGMPGARTWRRILTVDGVRPGADLEVVDRALAAVSPAGLRVAEPA
jgi:tRNA-dihydrouridine synthase A